MSRKKTAFLCWLGIAVCAAGCAGACMLGFPAGLLIIIPAMAPFAVKLYSLWKTGY